jgi:predicted transcriptional regulator of viral defense system
MDILLKLQQYAEQPIPTQLLLGLLKSYKRPYDKIVSLVEHGYLVQLRRGLYITTSLVNSTMPETFLISNHLLGPSYVSIDSALFHWGLIPERVYEVTAVTNKLSKKFKTPLGIFSYTHIPLPYYSFGIEQLALTETQTVMIASPEKALSDKIITTAGIQLRSSKQVLTYLEEELRIEKESLRNLNTREMVKWLPDCTKQTSIKILIETISRL